jgi:AcrR family transcriptional regulator
MKTAVKTRTTAKMSSEERRAAIINAVRQVFAERGFDGTTTRALAQAAGVSEALLFKHFPNKEALFSAMQLSCCNEDDHGLFSRLMALEPSASTLVLMTHFFVSRVAGDCAVDDGEKMVQKRLMLRSLAEDGEFARIVLRRAATEWTPRVEECVKAAVAAGEAVAAPVRPGLGGWFIHHLAVMIKIYFLPAEPVVDYGVSREKLIEQTVWFALRGVGLKEEVIKRHYNAKALALFAG